MDLAGVVYLHVMDPPDLASSSIGKYLVHGCHAMDLCGEQGLTFLDPTIDVWGGLEEQGLTSMDPREVKPLLTWPALGHPSLEPHPHMAAASATSEISSMTLCGKQREKL
jgi:hypothetical protein